MQPDLMVLLIPTADPWDEEAKAKQSVFLWTQFCTYKSQLLTPSWSSPFRAVSCMGDICQFLPDCGCNFFLQQLLSLYQTLP